MRKLTAYMFSIGMMFSTPYFVAQVSSDTPYWYGVSETQGIRPTMEDAHSLEVNSDYVFVGLYDGHGGRNVADFAAQQLHKNIDLSACKTSTDIGKALHEAFIQTHKALDTVSFDAKEQGCAAITILIKDKKMYIANAGDSRAVLSNNGNAVALSEDHKPNRLSEKQRIEQLGGKVFGFFGGVPRVNGILAVARALGDKALNPYVIPDPEIREKTLDHNDEFLILACDGVWDVIDNQTAVDIVKISLEQSNTDVNKAADTLKTEALQRGSTDNISVIVINLKSFQPVP